MELMIAVAIVGILTAIAYPQYGKIVNKSRRSDAQAALLQAGQDLERCKTVNYSYADCALTRATSPEDHYDLTLESTASTYKITATAKGVQAGDTECGTMTLNQQGVREPAASVGCWPN